MNDNKQKKIMIYSVGHTGSHFLIDLIESCTQEDKIARTDGYVLKNVGVEAREKYTIDEFIKISMSFIPKDKLNSSELITFWSHIYAPDSTLLKSITNNKPPISIVSPMRDPLLRLNTNMFWNNGYDANKESRLKHIKDTVKMFLEILSIPDEHRFLLPVDLYNLKYEAKENSYKGILKFCDIKPTLNTEEIYKKWKPAHETKTHPANITKASSKKSIFEDNKIAVLNKDTKTIMKNMNPEFTYLQRQEDLKEKLERYGYRDLVWW